MTSFRRQSRMIMMSPDKTTTEDDDKQRKMTTNTTRNALSMTMGKRRRFNLRGILVDIFLVQSYMVSIGQCFVFQKYQPTSRQSSRQSKVATGLTSSTTKSVKVGDLLGDLPTPCLLLELSLAEGYVNDYTSDGTSLDDILGDPHLGGMDLNGCLFVHTSVTDTSDRDAVNQVEGSGKSYTIGQVDCSAELIPGGAYLGIGLANHHVGGYYWARGMGMGASLPAHGIAFRHPGELYWKKRGPGKDARETTEESSNSNDGKRSEWADFLAVGDTVQLIPENAARMLQDTALTTIYGVRRIGRPLGADPIVERIWIRNEDTLGWVLVN